MATPCRGGNRRGTNTRSLDSDLLFSGRSPLDDNCVDANSDGTDNAAQNQYQHSISPGTYPTTRDCKKLAYRIVNHRKRHGFFTHWEELAEVKEFPLAALGQVKQRDTLRRPDLKEDCPGPRRMKPSATERE